MSPTGKRAVFEARGDIFTVPAEHGPVLNLTRSSGVAERYPRWSPDGKTLAYWSDRSGEYELTLRPADGAGAERTLTSLGAGFRYAPHWSPDSKRIAFVDQAMRIRIDRRRPGTSRRRSTRAPSGWRTAARRADAALVGRFALADLGARHGDTATQAVFLYDTKQAKLHQATSGYFNDAEPVFDPDGKYLYFMSNRAFEPVYSDFDNSWSYPNSTRSSR